MTRQEESSKKQKKAPLVYINRLKMSELDENNNYTFVPQMLGKDGKVINPEDLDEKNKKIFDQSVNRKINFDKRKHMILTAESELIRIILHLSKNNDLKEITSRKDYAENLLSLKVGHSYTRYKEQMKNTNLIVTYNGKIYKRIIVSSSHSRTQKVMMVAEELWDKAMDILLCGLDQNTEYKFMSKWNSYIGLAATDSIPVSMPNIVVVPDKVMDIEDMVDVVQETVTRDEDGNLCRDFEVLRNQHKAIKTNLFDGAGIVTAKKARDWSKELNLDYIPASFQFRCIPCLKGKLFTMPVEDFAKEYGVSKIIDINGKEWDLFEDNIDCILTESQFKFHDLYENVEDWKEEFQKEVHGYKRTFNISEYDISVSELKDTTVMAYQPLQTLKIDSADIPKLCDATVKSYSEAVNDVDSFLKFRGISSKWENEDDEWSKIPDYYQAMHHNHALFQDEFIQEKMKQDLSSSKNRAYVGKIIVNGNYQTLTPDLFALMQHIFGLEVTGLLKGNEIYSNYWNHHLILNPWVDIIRSPHIAMEHAPVQVVTSGKLEQWFAYQKTGIILSVFGNTIALKLNSADFDGDHVLTVNNRIICDVAKGQISNTIYHEKIDKAHDGRRKNICVSDIDTILDCDYKGFKNNIGNVINPISVLWSLEQTEEIQDYIKIMSIIGSITIDYAKHGEEAEIPEEIMKMLKNCKKPYFMKYLKSLRKKKSLEKEMMMAYNMIGVLPTENLFDDSDCTMNQICHYMESRISDLHLQIGKKTDNTIDEFKWENFTSSTPNVKSHKYTAIRNKLIELQQWLYEVNNQKYKDDEQGKYDNNVYDSVYDFAKYELLSIESDVSKLVDTLLIIYYSDKKFMKSYKDKSILWGCFGNVMIQRAKGDFKPNNEVDMHKLCARSEKAKKRLDDLQEYRRKNFNIWEFDNEYNRDRQVNFYKEDFSWIKKSVPHNVPYSVECRRLLLILLYICRKCNNLLITVQNNKNNRITRTSLCKLSGIDRRNLEKVLAQLKELGIISLDIEKNRYLIIQLLVTNINCDNVLYEDVEYKKIKTIAHDKIREKI